MLNKLAIQNAKRSFNDYLIYLITVTIAFSLMFSFNMIIFSNDIINLSRIMINFKGAIILVSIIVILIISWLIYYTTRFMFEKRSKEFGTYLLLGMEKKQIWEMFTIENILLGTFSFIISFFIGSIHSQFMTALIMQIFELPFKVHFTITWEAFLLTLFYVILIYTFVIFKIKRKINKIKIYDLLYLEKKNENKMFKKKKHNIIILLISVASLILGLSYFHYLFEKGGENLIFSNIILCLFFLILAIYGITISITDLFTKYILKNDKKKYKNNHLFLIRNFSAKINTMGITMATLSLLICLTFLALNIGMILNGIFENQIQVVAPYDITIYNPKEENNFTEYTDFIKQHYTIEKELQYHIFTNNCDTIASHIEDSRLGYQTVDGFITISDYNILRSMLGLDSITLNENEFFIHSSRDIIKTLKQHLELHPTIDINDKQLTIKDITSDQYTTSWARGFAYIIVPDNVVKDMSIVSSVLQINTKEDTTEEFALEISKKIEPNVYITEMDNHQIVYSIANVTVRGAKIAQNRGFITIISFSLLYLAFIFSAVVGTILSIQSLSDSTKYKYRYTLLQKLGMETSKVDKLIQKQLLYTFLFPLLLPLFITFIMTFSLNSFFGSFLVTSLTTWKFLLLTIIGFLLFYLLYLGSTILQFKKNIRK